MKLYIIQKTQGFLFVCLSFVRHAQTTPTGFWNGVDWRALVKSRPPNIGKLIEKHFFFQVIFKIFKKIFLKIFWFFDHFWHFFQIFFQVFFLFFSCIYGYFLYFLYFFFVFFGFFENFHIFWEKNDFLRFVHIFTKKFRHKDFSLFLRPSSVTLRLPPWILKRGGWRALVKLYPPNIGKLKE